MGDVLELEPRATDAEDRTAVADVVEGRVASFATMAPMAGLVCGQRLKRPRLRCEYGSAAQSNAGGPRPWVVGLTISGGK